jgi:flagellar operon protein (TIGR03826 family)
MKSLTKGVSQVALANCKDCGRLFNRMMKDICPDCIRQDENDFLIVNDYLRDHRGVSPQEVSEQTEVALAKIYRYIREGRLIAANYPGMTYPCERCEEPIQTGRFCRPCSEDMKQSFNRVLQQETEDIHEKPNAKSGRDFYLKDRHERR